MEKPNLFDSESDEPTLAWLSGLQPASAKALKPDFLYRAGYEAGREQLLSTLRRRLVIGSAAALFIALAAGSLAFELGSRHGQALATRPTHTNVAMPSQAQRPLATPNNFNAQSTSEKARESSLANQSESSGADKAAPALTAFTPDQTPAISRWWQAQLQQCFAGTDVRRDVAHLQVGFGPGGAGWEDIVQSALEPRRAVSLVSKSPAPPRTESKATVKRAATIAPAVRLRGSLLPLRDSQLQRLMNELL